MSNLIEFNCMLCNNKLWGIFRARIEPEEFFWRSEKNKIFEGEYFSVTIKTKFGRVERREAERA